MDVSSSAFSTSYEAVPGLDAPKYVLGDVAAAADINPGTLKAWLDREPRIVPLGRFDQAGRGKGIPRLLTLRRVYAVAMTAELVSLGFLASRAGGLAFFFTDLSMEGARPLVETPDFRFFAANPAQDAFTCFESGKTLEELLGEAQPNYKPPLVSCAVIDSAALMDRVQSKLKDRGLS